MYIIYKHIRENKVYKKNEKNDVMMLTTSSRRNVDRLHVYKY